MKTFSKTLDIDDYEILCGEVAFIEGIQQELIDKEVGYRYEHEHRAWEYAMAMQAIVGAAVADQIPMHPKILDVGGGGSVFAPAIATALGTRVLQIDPQDVRMNIMAQAKTLSLNLDFIRGDFELFYPKDPFDVVVCLSVIEHVIDHVKFFYHLLNSVAYYGILFMTTDFSVDGLPKCPHHLRTYSPVMLDGLLSLASARGFETLGEPDWRDTGAHVNGYNFASLALRRLPST